MRFMVKDLGLVWRDNLFAPYNTITYYNTYVQACKSYFYSKR